MSNGTGADILAFGAHPDDVECAAAGVLLKHSTMGKSVAIIDITDGENGTYGTRKQRLSEAANAAGLMGVIHREQLHLPDGNILNNDENRMAVIQMIRKYRPAIVLANAVQDRHPDHAQAARLVADAAFLSGLRKKKTIFGEEDQPAWRPHAVYHYIQDQYIVPDFVIDISLHMQTKLETILAYKSQFVDHSDNGPGSIQGLLNQIKSMNSIYGRPINAAYAEGFTTNRYIGVSNFFQLI